MKIIRLQAENIKRLIAVDITPDSAVVRITGKNGAGKSSVLDAIWYALGGTDTLPSQPIRKGETKASITIDLDDLIVERRFTAKSSYLEVRNKEGAKFASPQTMLDGLLGHLTFDPLEFMRLKPRDQFEQLRELMGLGFAALDRQRAQCYEERTTLGRDVRRLQAEVAALPAGTMPPAVDVAAAQARVDAARAEEQNCNRLYAADKVAAARLEAAKTKRNELRTALAAAEKAYDQAQITAQAAEAAVSGVQAPDVDAALRELAQAQKAAVERREHELAAKKREELRRVSTEHAQFERAIAAIDEEKRRTIERAPSPLPGLALADGEVMWSGLPLAQASSAEQLRISVAVAMALNPKLRVLRITDGSLLDSASFAMIEALAQDHDYQIWIEQVDETGKIGIVIEDGAIA